MTALPEDFEFLGRALALARSNVGAGRGGPFGALIVRGGAIVAEGSNLVTSSHDPTAHAEVVAIRAACQLLGDHRLHGCTIYCSCEPCPMCLASIYWSRLDRMVFAATKHDAAQAGFDDAFLYEELSRPLDERRMATVHLAHPDSVVPFDAWRASTVKIPY